MRVDRRCWARAVHQQKAWWGFSGIAKPRSMPPESTVSVKLIAEQIVLHDESHMDWLHYNEAKYVAESDDYRGEWEEYVRNRNHDHAKCPHGDSEAREAYHAQVSKMLSDEAARFDWACSYVDWDWTRNSVHAHFDGEENTYCFLETHPVDAVWSRHQSRWLSLYAVKGYCGSCDEPLDESNILQPEPGGVHAFSEDCGDVVCIKVGFCRFDREKKPRPVFGCPSCGYDTVDVFDPEESFLAKHGRPFDWPPGAPYPPRCSFTGFPMDVPPYEE